VYIENEFGGRDQEVDETRKTMTISNEGIGEIVSFRYVGSFVQRDGGFMVDVKCRIKCDRMKWRDVRRFI